MIQDCARRVAPCDHTPLNSMEEALVHTVVQSRERYRTAGGGEMETVRVRDTHIAQPGTPRFIRLLVSAVGM